MGEAAIAVAGRADVLEPSLPASRAGEIELHVARYPGDGTSAIALRTGHGTGLLATGAMAGGALVAGDFDLRVSAANRLPEADVQAVLEVGSLLSLRFSFLAGASAVEELTEDILKELELEPLPGLDSCLRASASACAPLNISEKSNPLKSMLG